MSFFSRFSYSNPEKSRRMYHKGQVEYVERVFKKRIKDLRKLFPMETYDLKGAVLFPALQVSVKKGPGKSRALFLWGIGIDD